MSMWGKREEPAPQPPVSRPVVTPPPAIPVEPKVEAKKEPSPMSSSPFKFPEPESPKTSAVIGKGVKIDGQMFSKEDLYIDGEVKGNVECQDCKLTVGPNGKVEATVKARDVIVLGQIKGNVEATERIDIRKDARVIGDIKTARIVIEDGAYFKGSIDILKPDAKPAAAPRASQHTPTAPATGSVSTP